MTKGWRGRGGVAVVVIMEDCNDDDDGGSVVNGEFWYNDKMNDDDTQYKHSRGLGIQKPYSACKKAVHLCARNPETNSPLEGISHHLPYEFGYGVW